MSRVATVAILLGLAALVAAQGSDDAASTGAVVREPVLYGLITQRCLDTFAAGDVFNKPCVLAVLSKAVGLAIISLSFTYKLPQIRNIVAARDASGMSLASMYVEFFGFETTIAYSILAGNPLSSYGENCVIIVQNLVLLLLVWKYTRTSMLVRVIMLAFFAAVGVSMLTFTPTEYLRPMYLITIPIFSASRIPQIVANFRQGHTGRLAVVTVFMGFAGSAARVGTSLQEATDQIVALGFIISAVWNLILFLQVVVYWNKTNAVLAKLDAGKSSAKAASAKSAGGKTPAKAATAAAAPAATPASDKNKKKTQ